MSNAPERSVLARGRHALELGALRALSVVLHAAPRSAALALGGWIGRVAWALRVRRRRVMENLAIAFPQSDENERKRIGQESARNFGRTVAEFLRFPGGDRAAVGELVEIRGLDPPAST